MSLDDAIERFRTDKDALNKWSACTSVCSRCCSQSATCANAAKDATRANIEASNTWAFFQAKNIRRNSINLAADELELLLAAQPGMPAAARKAVEEKIKAYRAQSERLTKDPEKGEGLDQLFEKGKALETERDVVLRKDPKLFCKSPSSWPPCI